MSFVTVAPELLTTPAGTLECIGATVSQANTAAALATVEVLPAAADEVSAAIAAHFSQYAQTYHSIAAEAGAIHQSIVDALANSGRAYQAAEAMNAASGLALESAGVSNLAMFGAGTPNGVGIPATNPIIADPMRVIRHVIAAASSPVLLVGNGGDGGGGPVMRLTLPADGLPNATIAGLTNHTATVGFGNPGSVSSGMAGGGGTAGLNPIVWSTDPTRVIQSHHFPATTTSTGPMVLHGNGGEGGTGWQGLAPHPGAPVTGSPNATIAAHPATVGFGTADAGTSGVNPIWSTDPTRVFHHNIPVTTTTEPGPIVLHGNGGEGGTGSW